MGGCIDKDYDPPPPEPQPECDFSAVDARLQQFLDESDLHDSASYTVVNKEQGVVYEAALGDHTLDIVVILASASKMPAVLLLMALHDDESLDFDAGPVQRPFRAAGAPGLLGVHSRYGLHTHVVANSRHTSPEASTISLPP